MDKAADDAIALAEPFDGLSLAAVDWAALTHAFGRADDVPDYLRALMSEDAAARGAALGELFGTVYHQGSVYEASAFAVPFLVQAALRGPGDRAMVLFLMSSMGQQYGAAAADPATAQGAVRAEVARAVPDLAPLMHDPDVEVRRSMLRVLAACPPDLVRRLVDLRTFDAGGAEEDDQLRADTLTALTRLEPAWPELRDRLEAGLADRSVVVRQAVAIPLLAVDGPPFDPEVVDVLADAVALAGDLAAEDGANQWGPLPVAGGVLADEAGALDTLEQDPDAGLRAARRIVAARTEHSWFGPDLAQNVTDRWRDHERDAIVILADCLTDSPDVLWPSVVLYQIARMATRISVPDRALSSAVRPWADDGDPKVAAAAVCALARLRDEVGLEYAEWALEAAAWTGSAITAVCESFAEQAAFLVPSIRRQLSDTGEGLAQNKVIKLCTLLPKLGPAAAEAAPELLALAKARRQTDRLAAAVAHRAVTGDDTFAAHIATQIASESEWESDVVRSLGGLGPAALPCASRIALTLDKPGQEPRIPVHAARSYWQITGEIERPAATLAGHVGATPAGLSAVTALLEMRICPAEAVRTLDHLAHAPQRLLQDRSRDGSQHDDDTLRDRARALLELHAADS